MGSDSAESSSEHNDEQWAGDFDPLQDQDERRVLFAALDSFKQYRKSAHYNVTHRRRQNFYALPSSHWQMLAEPPFSYLETLDRVDDAIDSNAEIADAILECGLNAFGLGSEPEKESAHDWRQKSTANDATKAHSTIRQFYRDWTAEGFTERQTIYAPILQDLDHYFRDRDKSQIKVLVPGAGLGRLVFDICLNGYSAEGNEISYHQLLASNWVLNHIAPAKHFDLYPFVTQFTNNETRDSQFSRVKVPDVHPATAMAEVMEAGRAVGTMNMSAADFLVLYNSQDQAENFEAVTTVFFIDTAPNFIRYIEAIHNCLVPGGVWANIGPLLWHFDDRAPADQSNDRRNTAVRDVEGIAEPGSFELTNNEVLSLVEKFGFRIVKQEILSQPIGYIQDPQSMLQNLYRVSHWIAVKA